TRATVTGTGATVAPRQRDGRTPARTGHRRPRRTCLPGRRARRTGSGTGFTRTGHGRHHSSGRGHGVRPAHGSTVAFALGLTDSGVESGWPGYSRGAQTGERAGTRRTEHHPATRGRRG